MYDNSPGDEARVFASVNHFREPIHSGVRIAAAHRFDKSGDGVVMRVLVVIDDGFLLDALFGGGEIDVDYSIGRWLSSERGNFERVQGFAGITIGEFCQMAEGVIGCFDFHVTEAAIGIFQRAREQGEQVVFGERPEFKDLGARDKRGVDEEKGIVSGCADKANNAAFDVGQKNVLLRFVEAMNFVDEKYGGLALVFEPVGCGGKNAAHIRDVRFHPTEALEFAFRLSRDDLGERSFAGAGWAIKDERLNSVGFDGATKKLAGGEDVGLADEIVEIARPHSRGEGLVALNVRGGYGLGFCRRSFCEQVIASHGRRIR